MNKTIIRALRDEVHYPISKGFVENKCVERGLDPSDEYSLEVAKSAPFKGALADCLYSLVQAINFSEAGKSIGNLSADQRKVILKRVNALYSSIGEPEVETDEPTVFFGG